MKKDIKNIKPWGQVLQYQFLQQFSWCLGWGVSARLNVYKLYDLTPEEIKIVKGENENAD